jgi:fido (protein-threonine AMPylation protein)
MSADDDDRVPAFSTAELRRLTQALLDLAAEIHRGKWSTEPLNCDLIRKLHDRIFGGIRDYAGRIRNRDWGSDFLTFGPHRSYSRYQVMSALEDELFRDLVKADRSLVENQQDPSYEESAFHIAVWAHAKLIRIHPFEDGNGRTGRAFLNVLLVRFGLRPVSMEMCKTEYIALLNEFYASDLRNIQPLLDGILRLAVEQLA